MTIFIGQPKFSSYDGNSLLISCLGNFCSADAVEMGIIKHMGE